jgi:hypothetical protein
LSLFFNFVKLSHACRTRVEGHNVNIATNSDMILTRYLQRMLHVRHVVVDRWLFR